MGLCQGCRTGQFPDPPAQDSCSKGKTASVVNTVPDGRDREYDPERTVPLGFSSIPAADV